MAEPANDSRKILPPILGALIALASLVPAIAPGLAHDLGPAPDLFEATERHVRWGLGVALGGILAVDRWRRPFSVLFAWVVLCLSGGYLLARFIGIAIEGPGSRMQWILVAVELVICVVAAAWIRRRRDAPDRARA